MARTTFVVRFRTVVGVPPLIYLLNWLMRLRTVGMSPNAIARLRESKNWKRPSF
jgi:hypothetical protein